MRLFGKKKEQESKPALELTAIHRMLDELIEQSEAGVCREDIEWAYLKALIALHPECKNHPEVLAYVECVRVWLSRNRS